jgi:hypothetical protein
MKSNRIGNIVSFIAIVALSLPSTANARVVLTMMANCDEVSAAQIAVDMAIMDRFAYNEGMHYMEADMQWTTCMSSIPATDGPGQDYCGQEWHDALANIANEIAVLDGAIEIAESMLYQAIQGAEGPC